MRITLVVLAVFIFGFGGNLSAQTSRPNVVLIYADDIGYGDLSCYGTSAIKTPHVEQLAQQGTMFTSGYCTSATCTPSRYSMLTGEYAFRQKGTGILSGDAGMIIQAGRETLASVMQKAGYKTGVVGKWHLGLGEGNNDWNKPITPGPAQIGFDYSFLIPATGDRVPCVYMENDVVVGLDANDPISVDYRKPLNDEPTGADVPETLKMRWSHGHNSTIVNGVSRIGYMAGGQKARWVDEDMADVITQKAVAFMERSADQPFFLYFATHDIHVPRVPHPRFAGKSGMGPRGDALLQFDWSVGQILEAIQRMDLEEKTLVILSSDNGPVLDDGYVDQAEELLGDHKPAGPFRGGKYSKFEAGTRVPLIVSWPGKVPASKVSDVQFSQIDFLASLADLVGQSYDASTAPDSEAHLDALLGISNQGREYIVEHAGEISLRKGSWKFIPPSPGTAVNKTTKTELGNSPKPQLYDLSGDAGEQHNVADEHPQLVEEFTQRLGQIRGEAITTRKSKK